MGINQGFNRLSSGVCRYLGKSEIERGFVFISKDQRVRSELGDKYKVIVNGKRLDKKMDTFGRIIVGRELTKQFKSTKVQISIVENTIIIEWNKK